MVDARLNTDARVRDPDTNGIAFLVILGAKNGAVFSLRMLDHIPDQFTDNVSNRFGLFGF